MYFNKFEIVTKNNQIENIKILESIVCTDKQPLFSFNFDYKNKPFFGTISGNQFDFLPVIQGRNSFVPVIKGQVSNDNESKIKVRMRLHLLAIMFLILITTFILFTLRTDLNNGGLITLPIVYGFVIYEYLKQSKKYRIELEKHFK